MSVNKKYAGMTGGIKVGNAMWPCGGRAVTNIPEGSMGCKCSLQQKHTIVYVMYMVAWAL